MYVYTHKCVYVYILEVIVLCDDVFSPFSAMAIPSPSNIGYRPGDMALLGLVMAALLVLCLIVIGFLVSLLLKGNSSVRNLCEVSPCVFTLLWSQA